jgi:RNA polymerase sigma factor (sigma-70 family)
MATNFAELSLLRIGQAAAGHTAVAEREAGLGDERARLIGNLFKRHNMTLVWYVRGLLPSCEDAEEVVQSAYTRLLGAPQLEIDEERARSYLFKTAKNLVWDEHRRRRARCEQMHCDVDSVPLAASGQALDELTEDEQRLRALEGVLTELSARAREVFALHVQEEMTYQDIAEELGVSKKTVEREIAMVVQYCRSRLRMWRQD